MTKCKLFLTILFLAGVIMVVLYFASPYAPVVQPVRDIEEIWAIEDSRQESEEPLLTALENNGVALGYDWYENTFYCTLGLDNTDAWPQIHLTAPGAKDLQICFVDDYSYDWCSDAIREGYAYQIIAYNDQEFSYTQVVFTGLPILRMSTQEEVPAHVDVPGGLTISYDESRELRSNIRTHKRGATTLRDKEKNGYKVEFTRNSDGTRKTRMQMDGIGYTDEFILLSCVADYEMMRDRLSWDLYNMMSGPEETMGARKLYFCELFVNDRYQGVYLVFEPFDYEAELRKTSIKAAQTDSIYRLVRLAPEEVSERPIYTDEIGYTYELYYTRAQHQVFDQLQTYLDVFHAKGNQAFSDGIMTKMDYENVLRYYLLVQAGGMTDSIRNNLYIWGHETPEGTLIRLAPWDLDVSWGRDDDYNDQVWYPINFFDRMIEIDCGGVMRDELLRVWTQLRQTVFSAENVERLINQYTFELGDSGAFYRDALRWGKPNSFADGYNIFAYAQARFEMMDRRIEEIAGDKFDGRLIRIEGYTTFDEGELAAAMAQ